MFLEALGKMGYEVDPLGEPFDPALYEALLRCRMRTPAKYGDGSIQGYSLNDRLVRRPRSS